MTPLAYTSTGLADADALHLVVRASRAILGELPRRLTVQAVADELGVRTIELEAAFARLNTSVRLFMRVARLMKLHQQLRSGQVESVGTAFARWGFPPRSGEVAADYGFLFGEAPEATLASTVDSFSQRHVALADDDDLTPVIEALARLARRPLPGGGIRYIAVPPPMPAFIHSISID